MSTHRKNWLLLTVFIACLLALSASDPVTIEAAVGEDVCLPCRVQRERKAKLRSPTVNWQRSENDEVVHSFYGGRSHPKHQFHRFKDRTKFCSEDILSGNVSLLLKSVTPADFGNYSCHAAFYENTPQTEQTVELKQKTTKGANVLQEPKKPPISGSTILILVTVYCILAVTVVLFVRRPRCK